MPGTADLLRRHRPFLRYDSLESFRADSAGTLTDLTAGSGATRRANSLKRQDGTVLATAGGTLGLGFLSGGRYADGTTVQRADFLDASGRAYVADARRMHARPEYADRVYGHAVTDGDGRRWLQYWWFYYYNDKSFLGIGVHEGDWEMMQLRLAPGDGAPDAVTLAQHDDGERWAYRDLETAPGDDGPAPVLYVARGSHASLRAAGRHAAPVIPDVCDGRGPLVRPALEEIAAVAPAWVAWPGRWGSTRRRSFVEADSPRGPRFDHSQWADPAGFHAAARAGARAPAGAPEPPATELATPILRARREGDRVLVDYEFRVRAFEAGRPVWIVVALQPADSTLPPATQTFPIATRLGTLEPSVALRPVPYDVRASAADGDGNVSETVAVTLPAPRG